LPKTLELDLGDDVKMRLARIEPGKFRMGSPPSEAGRGDDELQHEAEITRPYSLGVFLVTQAQYRQVMGTRPSHFSSKGDGKDRASGLNSDEFPVENVSWEDAMDFCRIVSLLPAVRDKGWIVDLPTEAEWEYACRAGTETAYSYGSDPLQLGEYAWYEGNSEGRPHRVGQKKPNLWGFFDMHGNVFQWCKDRYERTTGLRTLKTLQTALHVGGCFCSPPRIAGVPAVFTNRLPCAAQQRLMRPPSGFG
jgi:formylglycine-generating enzyme required for sulfatase activity